MRRGFLDSKVQGANMGPTWVLLVPGEPNVGPMNLAIKVVDYHCVSQRGLSFVLHLYAAFLFDYFVECSHWRICGRVA